MKANIPSIKIKSQTENEKSHLVSLEYANTSDPRADVFNYAVEKKWIIIKMNSTK